jgi:hypothetical protein
MLGTSSKPCSVSFLLTCGFKCSKCSKEFETLSAPAEQTPEAFEVICHYDRKSGLMNLAETCKTRATCILILSALLTIYL